MTNTPTQTPGPKSRKNRTVVIGLGAIAVGAVLLAGFSSQAFTTPTSPPAATTTASATSDKAVFAQYLADSKAKLEVDGGVVGTTTYPGIRATTRIFQPAESGANLATTSRVPNQIESEISSGSVSTATSGDVLRLAATSLGMVTGFNFQTDVVQISPNTFKNTAGSNETYTIVDGLISTVSGIDAYGRWIAGVKYGVAPALADTFEQVKQESIK